MNLYVENDKIIVSIVCIVYNHEKYLRTALDGFINQKTTFKYEIIIHDDASTDSSADIIREYEKKYPNLIKAIYQTQNQYSKGVKLMSAFIYPRALGKYIAYCEGDDYWIDAYKLQKQVDFLEKNSDYVACVHNSEKLDMYTNKRRVLFEFNDDRDLTVKDMLPFGGCCYQSSSLIYKKKSALNLPDFYYIAKGFGDYPFSIHLALEGKVRFLSQVMSVYRCGTVSSFTQRENADADIYIQHYMSVIDMLNSVNTYTHQQYENEIQEIILQNKYKIEMKKENYKALRKEPYRDIYNRLTISEKLKIAMKQYFSGLYRLYRKKKYGQ